MTMGFSDRPLVAGTVRGFRYFRLDRLGRLYALNSPCVFRPGENIAECRKDLYNSGGMWVAIGPTGSGGGGSGYAPGGVVIPHATVFDVAEEKPEVEVKKEEAHQVGAVACKCGYYAYFGGIDAVQDTEWFAIIDGWGVCSVGDTGFRASKAALVALVVKEKREDHTWVQRMEHNYPDVPIYRKKKEALAAHPLTTPMAPTPETAEDFWTRVAR